MSQLFADGESNFVYPLRYIWRESGEESTGDALLFTVPKRFHKRANKRNLLRRRLKECYRLNRELLRGDDPLKGLNIALIYSTKEELEYSRIEKSLCRVLKQIAQECGRTANIAE